VRSQPERSGGDIDAQKAAAAGSLFSGGAAPVQPRASRKEVRADAADGVPWSSELAIWLVGLVGTSAARPAGCCYCNGAALDDLS